MNHEKLIELVREYTFLYDMCDHRYSDNQKKDYAWKEIAEKLQISYGECKIAWFLLRDAFRRAIKKQKDTKSGQASVSKKKWKYEDEMSFLLPYFMERPTFNNIPANQKDDNSDTKENLTQPSTSKNTKSNFTQPSTFKNTEANVTQPSTSRNTSKSYFRHRKGITQHPTNETPLNTLMKFILENKEKTNDIQQFFDCISTTVQLFPPRDRAIAKAKVFKVISQMEIEILERYSSTHSDYVSSPESYETQMPETPNDFYIAQTADPQSLRLLELNNNSESVLQNNVQ